MNKNLVNAARYLNAIHDVHIDEDHPKLEAFVRNQMLQMESQTLTGYWKAYLKDIDTQVEQTVDVEYQSEKEQEDNVFYCHGLSESNKVASNRLSNSISNASQEKKDTVRKAKDKKALIYRGSKFSA